MGRAYVNGKLHEGIYGFLADFYEDVRPCCCCLELCLEKKGGKGGGVCAVLMQRGGGDDDDDDGGYDDYDEDHPRSLVFLPIVDSRLPVDLYPLLSIQMDPAIRDQYFGYGGMPESDLQQMRYIAEVFVTLSTSLHLRFKSGARSCRACCFDSFKFGVGRQDLGWCVCVLIFA